MALDIEFPTPEEEFKRKSEVLVNKSPPISVELPASMDKAISSTDIQTLEKPFDFPRMEPHEKKGFFSSALHEFKELEIASHSVDYAYHKYKTHELATDLAAQNPRSEEIPKNWTPLQVENFIGVPDQFYSYIASSSSPDEMAARHQEVARQIKENEEFEDGSLAGKIFGGLTGIMIDAPIFAFMPMANSLRYAKWGENILQNMVRQTPGVALGSVAYTAAIDSTTTGKTMSDFTEDALVNTLAGIALTGGAHGVGAMLTGGEMYEARHALKMNFQGIEAVREVSPEGIDLGLKARPAPGSAANAMEITRAQEFLDSRMAKLGLFKIPYVGTGLEKGIGKISPIVRGITSEWGPMRSFMDRMADHSIETQGVTRGEARKQNFEALNRESFSKGFQMGMQIDGYKNLANGIGGSGPIAATKRLKQRLTDGKPTYDSDSWGRAVMDSRFSGIPSEVGEINELNNELDGFYKGILNDYQVAHGLEEKDLPVKTADAYLTRRYRVEHMNTFTGEENWNTMNFQYFREGDNLISTAMAPIERIQNQIKTLEEEIHKGINVEANRPLLSKARSALTRENKSLINKIHENEELANLLESQKPLTLEDSKQLKTFLKPWEDAQKLHEESRNKLSSAKEKLRNLKRKFETGEKKIGVKKEEAIPKKDYAKLKSEITALEKEIKSLEAETNKLQNAALDAHANLVNEVHEGNVKRVFYHLDEETGQIKFRGSDERVKFRPLYSSHGDLAEAEMLKDSKAYHSKITGTNADKLAQEMLSTLESRIVGSPLKERSYLIPDRYLLNYGFLSTDLKANTMLYATTLGRKTALATALKDFGVSHSGMKGFVDEMTKALNQRKAAVGASNLSEEKKNKEFRRLSKSFDKTIKFAANIEKVAMGSYARTAENQDIRDLSNAFRSWAAAARLGNLPLLQIPDIAVSIYRTGPWRLVRDGLTPLIKTMNGTLATEAGARYKKSASVAGMAIESVMHTKADQLYHFATESSNSFAGKISTGAGMAAKAANIASLSSFLEDLNQRMISNIAQSNLIESMYKYKSGTLGDRELRNLLNEGIDPKIQANKIIDAFESSSSSFSKKSGGYESEYWTWEDKEARNMMTDNIRKVNAKTLIRRGQFDSPIIANDPILSLLFTFTGWYFAALNRFVVPAMQRPFDSYMMMGTLASSALGALVDPMRSWTRGEEFNLSEDQWFASAISASPLMAPIYSATMKANAFIDNDFLNKLKNDRYRQRTMLSGMGGAPLGLAESLSQGARMVTTGKWNQADWKRLVNTIPGLQMWYMQSYKNDFMDSVTSGLPKNYASAPD